MKTIALISLAIIIPCHRVINASGELAGYAGGVHRKKWLLDLTAIATISDMVSLLDENRTLVYYGLKVLAKTPRLGLKLLLRKLNLGERITAEDVAFLIAPRINAASRMDHAETGFYLFLNQNKRADLDLTH